MALTLNEDMVTRGFGGGDGGFGGAGLGGGLLLGLLLGRGGLLGNNVNGADSNLVTTTDLVQQTLGDIKASIPFNEAQVQLALASLGANLTSQATMNSQHISSELSNAQLQAATTAALITRDIASVDTNIDRQSTAIQIAIAADGAKTRELITANTIADLNQRLTVAQLENSENRAIQREQVNSHNVTVTMNQAQSQQQLQAQRQDFLISQLVNGFGQIARATNSNVVVGSTGVGTSQTANPTNVNA